MSNEEQQFKSLFWQCWKRLYSTSPPEIEYREKEADYHEYMKRYDKEFEDWLILIWNAYMDKKNPRMYLPYYGNNNKYTLRDEPDDKAYEIPERHRTSKVKNNLNAEADYPSNWIIQYAAGSLPGPSRLITFWINLKNDKDRVQKISDFILSIENADVARYLNVNVDQQKVWYFGDKALSALGIWGKEGKQRRRFPSQWIKYLEEGEIFTPSGKTMTGTKYSNRPVEFGFPNFYKEFLSTLRTVPPMINELYFPDQQLLSLFQEWEKNNINVKLQSDFQTDLHPLLFDILANKRGLNCLRSWVEKSKKENFIDYYETGTATPYQLYNSAYVFNFFYNMYNNWKMNKTTYKKYWIGTQRLVDIQPVQQDNINSRIDINSRRPINIYSPNVTMYKIKWMTTFAYWNVSPWITEDVTKFTFGFEPPTELKIPEKEPDMSDSWWFEWTMINLMHKYPIPNVKYPPMYERFEIANHYPKSFEDIDDFEKWIKEQDKISFWGACEKQWEIYLAWLEHNIIASYFNQDIRPWQEIKGKEQTYDGQKGPMLNTFVDIGVLKTGDEVPKWMKILPFTAALTAIFGDEWLSEALNVVRETFLSILDTLKQIAIEGAKIAGDILSGLPGFLKDFLGITPGRLALFGLGAAVAVGIFYTITHQTQNLLEG